MALLFTVLFTGPNIYWSFYWLALLFTGSLLTGPTIYWTFYWLALPFTVLLFTGPTIYWIFYWPYYLLSFYSLALPFTGPSIDWPYHLLALQFTVLLFTGQIPCLIVTIRIIFQNCLMNLTWRQDKFVNMWSKIICCLRFPPGHTLLMLYRFNISLTILALLSRSRFQKH